MRTRPQEIKDSINQLPRTRLPPPPSGPRIRDQRRDQLSFCIDKVGIERRLAGGSVVGIGPRLALWIVQKPA